MISYSCHPIGDEAVLIQFHASIEVDLLPIIHATSKILTEHLTEKIIEVVPGFQTIAVYYPSIFYTYSEMTSLIHPFLKLEVESIVDQRPLIRVPVCYEPSFGMDIEALSVHHQLTIEQVISLHCEVTYKVAIMGFLPGFPYLIGLNEALITPRKAVPRTYVPKGAVGIGGSFTGIYPFSSPGGWNIIGQTPLSIFDVRKDHPFMFLPGDEVVFYPITEKEFRKWGDSIDYD